MAKVFDEGILPVTFYADTALSSYQYHAAAPASTPDYVILATGASNPQPVGVLQDDNAASIGMATSVKTRGFTKAWVAACDVAGNACTIAFGKLLQAGSNGKFYASGSGLLYQAKALEAIASGSNIIQIEFLGISACAHDAS